MEHGTKLRDMGSAAIFCRLETNQIVRHDKRLDILNAIALYAVDEIIKKLFILIR